MDTAASLSPAELPESPEASAPWESEPDQPRAPRRRFPDLDMPSIAAQPVPWGVVALTLATAVLLVFGARAGGTPESRVMTFASADIAG